MNHKNINQWRSPNIFQIYENKRHFSKREAFEKNIKPAAVYDNADTQRLKILKENKGKAGIYR